MYYVPQCHARKDEQTIQQDLQVYNLIKGISWEQATRQGANGYLTHAFPGLVF